MNEAMIRIEMALIGKKKLGFVDGTIPELNPDDLLYPSWRRCNNVVKSWILSSVHQEVSEGVIYLPTAQEGRTEGRLSTEQWAQNLSDQEGIMQLTTGIDVGYSLLYSAEEAFGTIEGVSTNYRRQQGRNIYLRI
ncbi:Unknown protein [Striga hermonthica]|uniref:Uncharacterized protein n=1 Tax=Striga hermonthica TaxID=68872 RepID=A0A9N7NE43_STRHE|nr:Unknown protein [Striga hermonthica]